jgi:hypothetical protein
VNKFTLLAKEKAAMRNHFFQFTAIAFLLTGIFLLANPLQKVAYACTATSSTNPGPPPIQYTIEDRVTAAPIVLEGTVVSTGPGNSATVEVFRYFKGDGPALITGMRYGDGAMCQSPLFAGGPIIIFVSQWNVGEFSANYMGGIATVAATEENIQQIIAALGQEPTFPQDVTPTPTPAVEPSTSGGDLGGGDIPTDFLEFCLAGMLSPLLMGIVLVRRQVNK